MQERMTPEIIIQLDDVQLKGFLSFKESMQSLVIFAHGSGSGRLSSRNQFVARKLNEAGIGTLLFDLLTEDEEALDRRAGQLRFNIPFLASRLIAVTDWVLDRLANRQVSYAYFGASTGAAAALIAAAERASVISAVVSRGGRPDLAEDQLTKVVAPTLLLVGEHDDVVIELNKLAESQMVRSSVTFQVIEGATHLFEERGALEQVAEAAKNFFMKEMHPSFQAENADSGQTKSHQRPDRLN